MNDVVWRGMLCQSLLVLQGTYVGPDTVEGLECVEIIEDSIKRRVKNGPKLNKRIY